MEKSRENKHCIIFKCSSDTSQEKIVPQTSEKLRGEIQTDKMGIFFTGTISVTCPPKDNSSEVSWLENSPDKRELWL